MTDPAEVLKQLRVFHAQQSKMADNLGDSPIGSGMRVILNDLATFIYSPEELES